MDAHQDKLRGLIQEIWQLQSDLNAAEARIPKIRTRLAVLYAEVDDALDEDNSVQINPESS